LTLAGEEQAERLGRAIKNLDMPVHVVHSSGLMRADTTADIALAVIDPRLRYKCHVELKERHWGIYQGQTGDDIKGMRDRLLSWNVVAEGGESNEMVGIRTAQYLDETVIPLLREGNNVLCVSHASPLATLQCRIERLPWESHEIGTPNAGARIYSWENETLVLWQVLAP
jgi:broad specificity phosphatase PhoE